MHIRPTILLPLTSRKSFLATYYQQGAAAGVFVAGSTPHAVGTEVDLEIAFAEDQMVFHSRGVIRAKRLAGRKDMPAGFHIEFLATELATRDIILNFANGQAHRLARRKWRRFPVVLSVECLSAQGRSVDVTEDISREGAFIRTSALRDVGSTLTLRISPPGDPVIDLRAEVMWHRKSGLPGMGVRFIFDHQATQKLVVDFIDKVKQRLA